MVDIAASTTRTPILELPSVINESCVFDLKSDYAIDSTKHHFNNAFFVRRELVKNSSAGSAIVRTLKTSIDTTYIESLFGGCG